VRDKSAQHQLPSADMPRDGVPISPVPFPAPICLVTTLLSRQCRSFVISASTLTLTRRCGHVFTMFNERCRVASPLSISYVRSADRYLQPRFKRWWSHRGAFLAGLRQQCTGQYSSMSDARRLQLVLNAPRHM